MNRWVRLAKGLLSKPDYPVVVGHHGRELVRCPDGIAIAAGTHSTAEVGSNGILAFAGYKGTALAGDACTAIAGEEAVAGEGSFAKAGLRATAGHSGVAEAGWHGSAKAGDYGVARVRRGGIASAGVEGRIEIEWEEQPDPKVRLAVGYVGEGGLKPDTWYRVDDQGKFEEVTDKIKVPVLFKRGTK